MERTQIIERVKSGIESAKRRGIHCGRPQGSTLAEQDLLKKYRHVAKDIQAGISLRRVARLHEIALGTTAKIKKAMESCPVKAAY